MLPSSSLSSRSDAESAGHLHARRAIPPLTSSALLNPAPKQPVSRPCGQPGPIAAASSFPPEHKAAWRTRSRSECRSVGRQRIDFRRTQRRCPYVHPYVELIRCRWGLQQTYIRTAVLPQWSHIDLDSRMFSADLRSPVFLSLSAININNNNIHICIAPY